MHQPPPVGRSWWTLGCLLSLTVSTLMFLVSFSTRAWLVSYDTRHNVNMEMGLWRACVYSRNIETVCETFDSPAGKFRATQAFMCLAFIGYIAAWLLMFISIRSDSRSKYYVIASIVCPFVVGFLLMVAVSCMADHVQTTLGYSFYLGVFSCLFAFMAGILRGPDLMEEQDDNSSNGTKPAFTTMEQGRSSDTITSSYSVNPSYGNPPYANPTYNPSIDPPYANPTGYNPSNDPPFVNPTYNLSYAQR